MLRMHIHAIRPQWAQAKCEICVEIAFLRMPGSSNMVSMDGRRDDQKENIDCFCSTLVLMYYQLTKPLPRYKVQRYFTYYKCLEHSAGIWKIMELLDVLYIDTRWNQHAIKEMCAFWDAHCHPTEWVWFVYCGLWASSFVTWLLWE